MTRYRSSAHHAVIDGEPYPSRLSVFTYTSGHTDLQIANGAGDVMHIEITAENRAKLIAALEAGNAVQAKEES